MSDTDTIGGLAAQDSYDPFAAEQFVPPAAADWARQAAPQDVATLQAIAQPVMGALAAPGQALASTTPITSEQMIAPAADIAGLTTLGAGAAPATANELRMGIKAYHGSPYDFDKFDLSKIGTGEGAQAYGHGLYFAGNEKTAKAYRDQLADRRMLSNEGPVHYGQVFDTLQNVAEKQGLHPDQSYQLVKQVQDKLDRGAPLDDIEYPVKKFNDAYYAIVDEAQKRGYKPNPGRMYEVDINADPAHFLDWDKSLRQMSPEVQQRLNDAWLAHPEVHANQTGRDIYRNAEIAHGGKRLLAGGSYSVPYTNELAATQALRDASIPGIKYLDQGSRGAYSTVSTRSREEAEAYAQQFRDRGLNDVAVAQTENGWQAKGRPAGTSNYVVFNPEIINILRKYGLAGAAPAGLGALAAQDNYQQ